MFKLLLNVNVFIPKQEWLKKQFMEELESTVAVLYMGYIR